MSLQRTCLRYSKRTSLARWTTLYKIYIKIGSRVQCATKQPWVGKNFEWEDMFHKNLEGGGINSALPFLSFVYLSFKLSLYIQWFLKIWFSLSLTTPGAFWANPEDHHLVDVNMEVCNITRIKFFGMVFHSIALLELKFSVLCAHQHNCDMYCRG